MKLIYFATYCFFFWATLATTSLSFSAGITYASWYADRFGDYIAAYCDCRWLSYKHNLEFYFKPFKYSDQLVASITHKQAKDCTSKRELWITSAREINSNDDDLLYVIRDQDTSDVCIDWNDRSFLKLIKEEIYPVDQSIKKELVIPQDHYSVALHVRRGGGGDRKLFQEDVMATIEVWEKRDFWHEGEYADVFWPTRFPSDKYYIEQLRALALCHPDKKLYVHIFTDDPAPEKIAEKYEKALNNSQIQFEYRKENNKHNTNVVEDFFAIMNFDALIRSSSFFSGMAGLIGEVSYIVYPIDYWWEGRKLITTRVRIIERIGGKTVSRDVDVENN